MRPVLERRSFALAARDAVRFNRSAVSVRAGVIGAIPVAAVLLIGAAAGNPVAGVTMAAGAMLVGVAWRVRGGRPPIALLGIDALVMALSTFVGCATGTRGWLHLAVLFAWCLLAGLLVSFEDRRGVIGTQAVIAVVVFGRFPEPATTSAALAGMVLAGGWAQVLVLTVIGSRRTLRRHRAATAAAYRLLSTLAADSSWTSTAPAADALDQAQDWLALPGLFREPALTTVRSLVDEGHRLLTALSAVRTLLRRDPPVVPGDPRRAAAERMLALSAEVLDLAAGTIEGAGAPATALQQRMANLSLHAEEFAAVSGAHSRLLSQRLATLAEQLQRVSELATAAGESETRRERRPNRCAARAALERAGADLAQLRANVTLGSPAGRHALRLAVVVLLAELISRHLPLERGYWMVMAAAATLRPEFGATFTRGTERALGTCLGVGVAGAIALALHPAGGVTFVLVGALAWAGFAMLPASFAVGFGFITAVVVFLLNTVSPDTLLTAWARLLDTLVGGSIGLLAYVLWPTWSVVPAWKALSDLLDAERAYLRAILGHLIDGRRGDEDEFEVLSRRARLAWTTAENRVARSLSEPVTRRIDPEESQGVLAAMERLVQVGHVLRLDLENNLTRPPLRTLAPLAGGVDELLSVVAATLQARRDERQSAPALPDLLGRHPAFGGVTGDHVLGETLSAELDELVEAANCLVAAVRPERRGNKPLGVEQPYAAASGSIAATTVPAPCGLSTSSRPPSAAKRSVNPINP